MTIKKSLITTDWRAKGLKGNPGTRSLRICFLLLIMLMVPVAVVSAAYIDSISPVTGSYIGGDQISIAGGDFNAGITLINFSLSTSDGRIGGIQLTNVTRVSSILITAITPAGSPGITYNLSMIGANTVNYPNAFTYQGSNPPTISGINGSALMAYASISGTTVVNISGTFLGTATSATFGGTSNGTVPFIANDGINITMKAPARTATGLVTVSVNTPNGSASYRNLTYVGAPVITSVSPAYGSTFGGDVITIIGTGDLSGATLVGFNTTNSAVPTKINATAVSVITPSSFPAVTFVNITTAGGTSGNSLFTYYDPPSIDTVSNPSGAYATSPFNISIIGGTTVTIYGKNFTAASMSGATVKFNGTAATSVTRLTDTSLTAVVPAWPFMTVNTLWQDPAFVNIQNATVNVTTLGGTSKDNFGNITYNIFRPNITSISPTSGSTGGGDILTITGKNLSYARLVSFNSVTVGNPVLYNKTVGVTVVSDTQITCIIPSSTLIGDYRVNVTTPAGTLFTSSDVKTYTYTATAPTFTNVSPNYGPDFGGQWVNITGSGFSGTAAGGVVFNGQAGTGAFVFNDTSLTVATPAYPKGTSFITINAAGGSVTQQGAYTFAGQPQITSLSPVSGSIAGGNTITINGRNLTGASVVTFNFTKSTGVTVINDGQITAILPAANQSATGPVNVNVTTYLTSSSIEGTGAFNYGAGPTLTSISPVSGSISGSTFVTLTGANLQNATSVTFGGLPATNFTRSDLGNQVTANTPATNTPGVVYPLILTPAGSVTNTSVGYTYYGSPVITSIAPSSGPTAGGNSVTITGTSFVGATQVTFDGIQATNFAYVNSTMITANAPAHAAGAVTVLVAATGGTGTGTYTYQAPPTVTGISPPTGSVLGGTSVTITGTNLLGATAVNFGSTAATNVNVVSGTSITATSPAGTAGVVNVTVTTASGISATSTASQFTYIVVPSTTAVGVFRAGTFYRNGVSDSVAYGLATDTPITGNWDGGSTTNVGVWRSGTFYLRGVSSPVAYGLALDQPITGAWTSGSPTNVGVFRSGTFYLRGVSNSIAYGMAGDTPITGDWNGDGITEVGVFRSGTFYLNGVTTPVAYGLATDTPITGVWTAGSTTNVGVFRSGTFYLNGGTPVSYGLATDTPVTGDWNGDGITEVGVFRSGTFYLNGVTTPVAYGLATDTPITGKWV